MGSTITQSSGNGWSELLTSITKAEVRPELSLPARRSGLVTARRIRSGLEALAALPYYLLVCPFTRPRRTARFLENLYEYRREEKVHSDNQRFIPTVDPEHLFPGLYRQRVSLLDLGSHPSGTTFLETYLMVCLIRSLCARTIFEFGTSEGRTTLQFALSAPEEATIYTLDLPECRPATQFALSFPTEACSRELPIGGLFQKHAESRKIKQLLQDSATANFEPFRGKMDFIFIDGDHGRDYLKSDSENAFSMLSQRGVVLWHDYGGRWPDVAAYLLEIAGKKRIYHLHGTSLAIHAPGVGELNAQ